MSDAKSDQRLPKPLPDIETTEGVSQLLARAIKGDAEVRPLLGKFFDRGDEMAKVLVESAGNVHDLACESMIRRATGGNLLIQEVMRRNIDAVRDELAGPNPTPLERILCERVALCWFDANETDLRFADQSNINLTIAEYRKSRRDRAHKRFLAACKTLAAIRKLALPALQVNIGANQVNMA